MEETAEPFQFEPTELVVYGKQLTLTVGEVMYILDDAYAQCYPEDPIATNTDCS